MPSPGELTASDLQLLALAAGVSPEELSRLLARPEGLEELLRRPRTFETLLGERSEDPMLRASPSLVFAALVERAAQDLSTAMFVEEWLGPRQSVPLFDTSGLRDFVASSQRRRLLAGLLASYTRVASGTIWTRTGRGWRRQRFSELDPLRLAAAVEALPPTTRAHAFRRLGDLSLFLSGVFPEHVAARPLAARHLERLARLLGGSPDELVLAGGGGLAQLEWIGRLAYRRAIASGAEGPARDAAVELAGGFGRARRVLNFITGRYLFPARQRWFGHPEGP